MEQNGEKIIIRYTVNLCCHDAIKEAGMKPYNCEVIITNFSRLLLFTNKRKSQDVSYKPFDFWFPTNYIDILMITKPPNIIEVLTHIKDVSKDTSLLWQTCKNITKENKGLKGSYDTYLVDKKKMDEEKAQFDVAKKQLAEEKEKFDMEKNKLAHDIAKLEHEKKYINQLKLVANKIVMGQDYDDSEIRVPIIV